MINALTGHEITSRKTQRPVGGGGGGETQLNRPSDFPARPCCTVSPPSSFSPPNPDPRAGEEPRGLLRRPLVVCLAFELPNRQPQKRQLVLV